MRRENINYIVVGLFVLIIMVAFFTVLYKITGRSGPTDNYFVEYNNVTGIKYGTLVLYEGFQIGQVEEITPIREENTRYRLMLSVNKGWNIPSDSVANIVASGLLSAITIDIKEGESRDILKPGDMLEGREAANIFSAVNEVAANISDLSRDSIRPLIDNLNVHLQTVVDDLTDLTSNSIRPLISDVHKELDEELFRDLNDLLVKLNDSADRLLNVLDDENQENLDSFLENMRSSAVTLNEVIFRIEDTRVAMNEVLLNIDNVISTNQDSLKASIEALQKSLTIVSGKINAIVYHIEGSSRNVHELSRHIRENPGSILRNSPQTEKGETE